uniref:Membrane proteins related to metalloendopeptidases n=1 Tax=uncultured myxobacterium HF0130_06F04 TaxID=723555 RepID=E7C2G1_9BACT|nr:membrane proteins related to metalloendopeptidases [uncultured myxobacterium HF0130_06F04]
MLQRLTIALALFATGCIAKPPTKMAWTYNSVGQVPAPGPKQADVTAPLIATPLEDAQEDASADPQENWQMPTPVHSPTTVAEPLLLDWPLAATGITSLYGPRPDPVEKRVGFHYGIDMSASYGTQVMSSASGIVISAGWNGGHGRRVVVQHRYGYRTSYSHLSQIVAAPGRRIGAGESIGLVGNSGRSTGPHLHFEITRYGKHLDPLDILGVDLTKD